MRKILLLTGLIAGLTLLFVVALAAAPVARAQETPPSTATAVITGTVVTEGPRLRVRAEPDLTSPIVARLVDDSVVDILGSDASGRWLLVPTGAAETPYGWVSAAYVQSTTRSADLPLAAAPPVPTATPTVQAPAAPATGTIPPTPPPPPGAIVAPVAATTPAAQPVTAAPGLYGKIAVPVFDENRKTYDVWLVNADGSGLRSVVEQASSPVLSYDGTHLAYRRWRVDDRGIVVATADGANPWRITDKLEDVLPSFSPDRTKVAFSTYRWGDRKNRLYYAWSDEQNRVAWEWGAGGHYGEDPYWALDGRIYFRVTRPERAVEELWSMDGATGDEQKLILITQSIRAPAVSPDVRTVAYMAFTEGNWELFSLDLATRAVTRLTDDAAEDGLPTYSPNGEYIAFVSDRGGAWGLWRMAPDGSDVQLIATLPGPVDGRVEFEPDYLNNGWLEEQISWSP